MDMGKITSNVIKRIEMFQSALLPVLEPALVFMPPLLKTVSIEKINKIPVVSIDLINQNNNYGNVQNYFKHY